MVGYKMAAKHKMFGVRLPDEASSLVEAFISTQTQCTKQVLLERAVMRGLPGVIQEECEKYEENRVRLMEIAARAATLAGAA